jgi:quercetin dioxygenase-like cupin family protein
VRAVLISFAAGLGLGTVLTARGGDFMPVRSPQSALTRVAPPGSARVHMLAPDAQSAFVGLLEIDAGGQVPEHRDESEEFVYFLEGGGTITVDGRQHTVAVGDLVYMPAGAAVSFQATDAGATKVLQIFAPPTSAEKYDRWQPEGAETR